MRIALVHLSDIHFREDRNWISDRVERIAGAVWAEEPTTLAYVLVFSGDLAFSGKPQEYERAEVFVQALRASLAARSGSPSVTEVYIPGNHDCNFDRDTDTRRLAVSYIATDFANFTTEGDIARQCVSVQDDFFAFAATRNTEQNVNTAGRFLSLVECSLQSFTLRIHLYNTAWISTKREQQGQLLYPIHAVESQVLKAPPADIVLSVLHHPYNWLQATNARQLRTLVERSSDVVLTGHEHETGLYFKELTTGESVYYFEGGVLQSEPNSGSGFNALFLDTDNKALRMSQFTWQGGLYTAKSNAGEWSPIRRNKELIRSQFDNKPEYRKFLQDIGTGFSHSAVKTSISREDLFIYPDLVRRSPRKGQAAEGTRTVESNAVLQSLWESKRVLISGADLSGKTTVAKSLYCDFKHKYQLVPIMLSGRGLAATNPTEVKRVLDAAISEQYGLKRATEIAQLSSSHKALIVDDFDHCDMSHKGQHLFFEIVWVMFDVLIVFVDEFFALEELSQQPNEGRVFADLESYEIREFGYYLRGQLIEKWVRLGRDYSVARSQLDQETSSREQLISTLLGRNLLPSFPLTILTFLQAWESNKTHDTPGSYGYMYETLIIQALSTVGLKGADVDVVMTFLSMAAYRMFTGEKEYLNEGELRQAATAYFDYYRTRLPSDVIAKLVSARVIYIGNGEYRFRYPYYRYFFVARYLRDNMHVSANRLTLWEKVQEMASHVHYDEYANVLMFYIYLSKDTQAIRVVVDHARIIYNEYAPCDFEGDVAYVNDLYTRYRPHDKVSLPQSSPEDNRDQYRRELDKVEDSNGATEPLEGQRNDKIRYDRTLSDIIKVHIATRMLQILGQIIRNSPGSVSGDVKKEVASEAYLLGLRTLNAVLRIPERNLDGLRNYIMGLVREHRAARHMPELLDSDMSKIADEGVIHLAHAFSHGMIRRISQAVGLRQLVDIYSDVLQEHERRIPVRLIDLNIKLDLLGDPPVEEILELERDLKNSSNHYAHNTLRDIVFAYLYLSQVDYKSRSKLMSRFEITSAVQTMIENPEKRDRRTKGGKT